MPTPKIFESRLAQPDDLRLRNALVRAASGQSYYRDDPPGGTDAESFDIRTLGLSKYVRLSTLWIRCDLSPGAGETVAIRVYRYRRTAAGVFTYSQITDTFVGDSANMPYSTNIDLSHLIRDGYALDREIDSLAVSNVHTLGADALRALRVDLDCELAAADGSPLVDEGQVRSQGTGGGGTVATWPAP